MQIKTDVETQGDFIRLLIKEVEPATFINIEDDVAFVKWFDDELSFLGILLSLDLFGPISFIHVSDSIYALILAGPEHNADAMREAAFGYCDLNKLESEASSFRGDPRQLCSPSSRKCRRC